MKSLIRHNKVWVKLKKPEGLIPLFLVFLVLILQNANAQKRLISYEGENIQLSEALDEIGKTTGIRLAFDSKKFSEIRGSLKVKNLTDEKFMDYLTRNFPVRVKMIQGTYILTIFETREVKPDLPYRLLVRGFVTDRLTGEKLRYCNIGFPDGRGTTTNELGFFSFETTDRDTCHIVASYVGYQRLDTVVNIEATHSLFIGLKPVNLEMPEVRVVSYEHKILKLNDEMGRIAINPSQSVFIPGADENDLSNALTIVPGINFSGGQSGGMSIRGGTASENLVLIDGIPVMSTNHLLGNMSVLNGKFIQQVFVSRGGFDASSGERISGLIEMNGHTGIRKRPLFDVSANLLNFNIMGVIPISDKLSVTGAWRQSYVHLWPNYLFRKMLIETSDGNDSYAARVDPIVKFSDLNFKLSFHPSPGQELNFNFLRGVDSAESDFGLDENNSVYRKELAKGSNMGTSLNWSVQTGPRWHHSISAGISELESESVNESGNYRSETTIPSIKNWWFWNYWLNFIKPFLNIPDDAAFEIDNSFNKINEFRTKAQTEFRSGNFVTSGGIGLTRNTFSYKFVSGASAQNLPVDSLDNDASLLLYHFFIKQRYAPFSFLNLNYGIRGNLNSRNDSLYIQPRCGVEVIPLKNLKVRFSAGKYYQFVSQIRRIDLLGNTHMLWYLPEYENIGLLNSTHFVLSSQYEHKRLTINVEGYRKKITGKVNYFANLYKKITEQRLRYIARPGEELNQGIDIFLNYRSASWNHFLSYSLASSDERYYGINQGKYFPSFDNEIHRLKINEIYNYRMWFFSCSWNYGSGLPWLIPVNNWNSVNYERLDYFSQLDFSVVRRFRVGDMVINAGLSLLNVLNRNNIVEVNSLKFSGSEGSLDIRSDLAAISFTPVFFLNFRYQ